jgi:ABC-type transporter Mla subunit MlaD
MQALNNETLMLAFVALTGIALSAQAIILLAIFLSLRKAAKSVQENIQELRASILPVVENSRDVIESTRDVIARLAPKVEAATHDVVEMVRILREKSDELDGSVSEILERLHRQSARLDGMLSGALDTVDRAGEYVAEAVSGPVRQISAVLASIKAIVGALRSPSPASNRTIESADEDGRF